jgi:hypothetical protein
MADFFPDKRQTAELQNNDKINILHGFKLSVGISKTQNLSN